MSGLLVWMTANAPDGAGPSHPRMTTSELGPYGVDVQALCPGGTRTEFQRVAGLDIGRLGPLAGVVFGSPASVVATSLRNLGRRVTVIPGLVNKLTVVALKLLPRGVARWILGLTMNRLSANH